MNSLSQNVVDGSFKNSFERKFIERSHLQNILLQMLNRSIGLDNCFFQMFAVIFIQEAADGLPLFFLLRTSESFNGKVLSLYFL